MDHRTGGEGSGIMDQFDIIVIGGGSAGSAAAGRLAEDGKRTVCLVEAGGRNDTVRVHTPGLMPFLPKSSHRPPAPVPPHGRTGQTRSPPRGAGLGGTEPNDHKVHIRCAHFNTTPGWTTG